jgi:DNA invertase Pin-like site-specific DNA recombinase
MAKIGYARVSSKEQNLDRQLQALESVSKVFSDKVSGATTERPQLQAMLDYIREGDIVVVAELDRLGRNNKDLTEIMNIIQQKGATLEVLNLPSMNGIEDDNLRRLINNLVIELYKYQAESERKRIKERQAQGIALAKEKVNLKVVNKSLARMTLDFSLHSNFILMAKLKKMLNDKQVSIAGLFKGTEINLIFIENKKAI